jgi:short-subunit dehydrogenase
VLKIPPNFDHATVLVTGATSGIGYECARICAAAGLSLVIVSRNMEKLEPTREYFLAAGAPTVTIIPVDLSCENAAQSVFDATEGTGKKIDVLVNNAGIGLFGDTIDTEIGAVYKMIRLNIVALTDLCILFSRPMAARGKGFILNVGSMTGFLPVPFFSAYAASKSFVFNYSLALAAESRKRGVFVTCLVPGYTSTNFESDIGIESEAYRKFSGSIGMDPAVVAMRGMRALFHRKAYAIPGFSNKFVFFIAHIFPGKTVARLIHWVMSRIVRRG